MRHKNLSFVFTATVLLSVSCKVTSNSDLKSPIDEEQTKALQKTINQAVELRDNVKEFLQSYGVEIIREKNLTQEGTIQGSVNGTTTGGGEMFQIGNLSELANGLAGVSKGALNGALNGAPQPGALGDVLSGLSGFGGGAFKVDGEMSGSLSGSFKGEGYDINKTAHLFLVMYKDNSGILGQSSVENIKSQLAKGEFSGENAQQAKDTISIAENSALASQDQVQKFKQEVEQLGKLIKTIKSYREQNISDPDVTLINSTEFAKDLETWLADKRVQFSKPIATGKGDMFKYSFEPMVPGLDKDGRVRFGTSNVSYVLGKLIDSLNEMELTGSDKAEGLDSDIERVTREVAEKDYPHLDYFIKEASISTKVTTTGGGYGTYASTTYEGVKGLRKLIRLNKKLITRGNVGFQFQFDGSEFRLYF
ncbi:hypothetical protein N9D31_02030 [Oligoflexaceae bacterium]|nr:hypothetical protein [Oligoflexaceae bacterium]